MRKFGNGTAETTHYDKAGRVIVKTQNLVRGELVWAEGYLYGEDGKRTATVDNKGAVTLYEYNKKGQLATVYYPYTQGMINLLKEEAEENGLPTNAELGENKYLPANIKDKLVPLMNSMQYGLAYQISNLQIFIKESYTYDKNGNRAAKTTIYGTIKYDYDKENRLLSSGSRGQTYINYTYDNMGNLLTEESELKTTKYAYNAHNRLIYCEVIDKSKKEYAQTAYAYDALGRRVIVQDKGETALRTIYDGLTFDVIKQNPTFENALFTDSQNTGIRWSNNGKPTGDRYRYIGDEDRQDNNRYIYLDENTYKTTTSRYYGERTQISVNDTLAVQSTNEGTLYFTTDLFGSVSSVTDNYGYQLGSYIYDAFGTLVQGDLSGTTDFGYLGKQKDSTSELYNYGYRDYKPQTARFTTIDPIRDGTNWFSYVNNDPVNFVDLWGLFYYGSKGQQSSSSYTTKKVYKSTSVYVIRNDDKTGNDFNASVYVRKEDFSGNVTYSDPYVIGANCRDIYDGVLGSTTPDGEYYLSDEGTDYTPLYKQTDGSVNSSSFKNMLSLRTNDPNLTQEQRDDINKGDRFFHAAEFYDKITNTTTPYNNTGTPGGAGCFVSQTQEEQDKLVANIREGVNSIEDVVVKVYSLSNMKGCNK